ncbi:hypothetical protein WBJ53_17810 [Spirosoma sp. SC4-14]|uniref:hypothetical protein n=1 Tax=Spirosoma sp. SC4-14 TaxID=3128900 RepID=UPI0030CFC5B3
MLFNIRFYVYDDADCKTFHHLLADIQTNSLTGFRKGQTILLIERTAGPITKSYVIVNQPVFQPYPYALPDFSQPIDVYLVSEESRKEQRRFIQVTNLWHGPTL